MKAGELKKTAAVLEDAYASLGLEARPEGALCRLGHRELELESVARRAWESARALRSEVKDLWGGLRGQVYGEGARVKPETTGGVRAGGVYSMKYSSPPAWRSSSATALRLRLSVPLPDPSNLAAARAGPVAEAIRRGAQLRFCGAHGVNECTACSWTALSAPAGN